MVRTPGVRGMETRDRRTLENGLLAEDYIAHDTADGPRSVQTTMVLKGPLCIGYGRVAGTCTAELAG